MSDEKTPVTDKTPELKAEVNPLAAELAETKAKLKHVREVYCLRDIQGVLNEHNCKLMPSPDGKFVVTAIE